MLAPLIVGALADTAVFGVGQAMAIVVLPSAVIVYLTTLVRASRPTPRPRVLTPP